MDRVREALEELRPIIGVVAFLYRVRLRARLQIGERRARTLARELGMGVWVVRKTHQKKGAAFEDEDRARELRDRWQERYAHLGEDYEVVWRPEPLADELEAAEAISSWESLAEALGL